MLSIECDTKNGEKKQGLVKVLISKNQDLSSQEDEINDVIDC